MDATLSLLIAELEPRLAAIFLAAIQSMRSDIDYDGLVRALEANDIDAAVRALHIDRSVFDGYVLERQGAYLAAGNEVAKQIGRQKVAYLKREGYAPAVLRSPDIFPRAAPGGPTSPPTPPPALSFDGPEPTNIIFRFDMTNPRAEAKIRTEAASRVAGYVDEQIGTARKVIADGFAKGEGPQTIATDIAGRINPISKRREGGIVGLSDAQVGYVDSMRARLLSGDPDEMMKVLGRFDKDGKWVPGTGMTLRDRRYDAQVKKAIAAIAKGKPNPLTREKVDELTAKYSDRLLAKRANDIARTETAQGVMLARAEATKQVLDKEKLADDAVTKRWRHLRGPRNSRDWHLAMNDVEVVGVDTVFFLPDGSVMLHSHDPQGGAKNNVGCGCDTEFKIDWAFGLKGNQ